MNKKLDGITRKYLNEINEMGVDEDILENKFIEDEDVIDRDVTEH